MQVLKVSSKSAPNSVAGMIASQIKEFHKTEIQAIGAGALNQTMKAAAIARGFLAPLGINIVCIPSFVEITVDGESKTGMKITIQEEK